MQQRAITRIPHAHVRAVRVRGAEHGGGLVRERGARVVRVCVRIRCERGVASGAHDDEVQRRAVALTRGIAAARVRGDAERGLETVRVDGAEEVRERAGERDGGCGGGAVRVGREAAAARVEELDGACAARGEERRGGAVPPGDVLGGGGLEAGEAGDGGAEGLGVGEDGGVQGGGGDDGGDGGAWGGRGGRGRGDERGEGEGEGGGGAAGGEGAHGAQLVLHRVAIAVGWGKEGGIESVCSAARNEGEVEWAGGRGGREGVDDLVERAVARGEDDGGGIVGGGEVVCDEGGCVAGVLCGEDGCGGDGVGGEEGEDVGRDEGGGGAIAAGGVGDHEDGHGGGRRGCEHEQHWRRTWR